MAELEHLLSDLAGALDWPPTPRLSVRLETVHRLSGWRRPLALAAAAAVVVAAGLAAYPPSREAIAGWLNLHTVFHFVEAVPTPSPLPSGTLGDRLGLGTPTSLDAAQGKVSWRIAVPASLGTPDAVYYLAPPDGPSLGEVSLVYAFGPGIKTSGETGVAVLVTEARGQVNEQFFAKTIGPDATVKPVTAAGHQGYWISGTPHSILFLDQSGGYREETLRLATNTLILDDGGTIVRIEGDMTLDQALSIAAAL